MVGQRIGSYQVVCKLGEGGMGTVYQAVHTQIGRRVAIKVLHRALSLRPEFSRRFFNEARVANIVDHPGLTGAFEYGQLPSGELYLIMEYLDGQSLGRRLEQAGTLPVADAVRVCGQVAAALAAAHDKGVVHRDLTPENVMLVPDPYVPGGERAQVFDFGIAKLAAPIRGGKGPMTRDGVVLGTPSYMAPEQCRDAGRVDGKADVYSLGVVLYRMLAGRTPFDGTGPSQLMIMQAYDRPCPVRELAPDVPEEVATLLHAMLAKDPAERPAMQEVAVRLAAPSVPVRTPSRDRTPLWAGLCGAALGVLALLLQFTLWRPGP